MIQDLTTAASGHIATSKDSETPPAAGNPDGITARTTRKSRESWLLAARSVNN
ncbi:hypothetical protein [Methanosphaerula subterraneus]|uniref:hypothetical protein n=1 Tax=Methanosphaerula subterraneus TaxID=3350244 RepID=UPI003F85F7EF